MASARPHKGSTIFTRTRSLGDTIVVKLFNKIYPSFMLPPSAVPDPLPLDRIRFLLARARSDRTFRELWKFTFQREDACNFRAAPALRGTKSRSHITSCVGLEGAWRPPYNRVRVSRRSTRCIVYPL